MGLKEAASIITALGAVIAIFKKGTSTAEGTLKQEIKDKKFKSVVSSQGNMATLLKDFYIEPTIIVTENASDSEVIDKVASLATDIFTAFYTQTYKILTDLHEVDSSVAFKLLTTNNNVGRLKNIGYGVLDKGVQKFVSMDANSTGEEISIDPSNRDYLREFLSDELKIESGQGHSKKSKVDANRDDGVMGTALLRKSLELVVTVKSSDGVNRPIVIPVTVSAKVLKVQLKSIVGEIQSESKYENFRLGWLDYRSGVTSLRDLFLHSLAIKEYKAERFKNKDGLTKMLNDKKLASMASLVLDGAVGYQKFYNMLIITTEDLPAINSAIRGDIYNKKYKDMFLSSLSCLNCIVLDEDASRLVALTNDIDDTSTTSYKSLSKSNKGSGDELTNILKALMESRSLF